MKTLRTKDLSTNALIEYKQSTRYHALYVTLLRTGVHWVHRLEGDLHHVLDVTIHYQLRIYLTGRPYCQTKEMRNYGDKTSRSLEA